MKIKIFLIVILGIIFFSPAGCKKEERIKLTILSTAPATEITTSTATSGGTLTFNGKAEIYTDGVCWNTTGNPSTADDKTVDEIGNPQFVSRLSGLIAHTTYYVRAYATNSAGTAYGDEITFTTRGSAPGATTQPANIFATGVTMNGTVNANELSTIVTFEFGITQSYGQEITATQSPVTGNANIDVSAILTGMTVGTYHFRVKAVNSLGTMYGNDFQFTIGPTVATLAAIIDTTGVILKGTVNANHLSTTVTFEYGTTSDYGQEVLALQNPVAGIENTNVSATLTGLTEGTYHFRVKAVNSLGTVYGSDVVCYIVSMCPTVKTLQATDISKELVYYHKVKFYSVSAKLHGVVNANGLSATVTFEYGANFKSNVKAIPSCVTGNVNTTVNATLVKIVIMGGNCQFRVKAVNSYGTCYGETLSF